MLKKLQSDLREYYAGISYQVCAARTARTKSRGFNPLYEEMESFASAHPDANAFQLKAAQYEIIAENFTPVLFPNDPFFFETGLKVAEYDGHTTLSAGGWLFLRNEHLMKDLDPEAWQHYHAGAGAGLHLAFRVFDMDHHGFPYGNVLKQGLSGILARLQKKRETCDHARKKEFYDAAERGIFAVRRIAERFAEAADEKAAGEADPHTRAVYLKVAETARRVPWHPAESFYEGLAVIWFCHELGSVLDGIGMAIIGSPDHLLYDLYRRDLAAGRETEESAEELLKLWLIHTDCKLDFSKNSSEQFNGGEQGDTMTLGERVNELTFMTLKAHRELKLIYPKIHCRVSADSPEDYLDEVCKNFFEKRNVLDFLNDDVIVPALIRAGKDPEDAPHYVSGGCWENMLPECEHSQGANCYFDLARAMDLSIQSTPEEEERLGLHFTRPDHAESFEELYEIFMKNIVMAIGQMCTLQSRLGALWPEVTPAPFYSACMENCIEKGMDYSEGGSKYSPHGLPLTDAAVFVNSLMVFKKLCFDEKQIPLSTLLEALRANWQGFEELRRKALRVPHLGDGSGEAAQLLKRVLDELAHEISHFKNERGGPYQCGLYSYAEIYQWREHLNATADGRYKGDFLSQGLTPSRLHGDVVTDIFRDLSCLPLDRYPANSVLTLSLSSGGMDPGRLIGLIRSWCQLKCSGLLQLNCVDRKELEDAVIHPENHQDLIVRLYGFSTRFVTLEKIRQEEFLSRQILK